MSTNIEAKIINFKRAIRLKKPKKYIEYKFLQYTREYDNLDPKDVTDKQRHRDLFNDYIRYISSRGENE